MPEAAGDKPTPDPTVLTTEALIRGLQGERDYVDGKIAVLDQRLDAIDTATKLLNETVNRVPTETQIVVASLREVIDEKFDSVRLQVDEKFNSVSLQFKERDTRSERESRDNKLAVDAAFAAQEKQAVAQNDSNTLAINKSEQATAETIDKLAELVKSNLDALKDKLDDLTRRLDKLA